MNELKQTYLPFIGRAHLFGKPMQLQVWLDIQVLQWCCQNSLHLSALLGPLLYGGFLQLTLKLTVGNSDPYLPYLANHKKEKNFFLLISIHLWNDGASLVAQTVKNLPAMWETLLWSLSWEDPLEKGMATHSNILAWRIHAQRRLAGYSPWGHKQLDIIWTNNTFTYEDTAIVPCLRYVLCQWSAMIGTELVPFPGPCQQLSSVTRDQSHYEQYTPGNDAVDRQWFPSGNDAGRQNHHVHYMQY